MSNAAIAKVKRKRQEEDINTQRGLIFEVAAGLVPAFISGGPCSVMAVGVTPTPDEPGLKAAERVRPTGIC